MSAYRLSEAADTDLAVLYDHGIEHFGLRQADSYYDGLCETFERISDYPRAARLRNEMRIPMRAHRYGSHLIFYKIENDDSVLIVRIRHSREDWLSGS